MCLWYFFINYFSKVSKNFPEKFPPLTISCNIKHEKKEGTLKKYEFPEKLLGIWIFMRTIMWIGMKGNRKINGLPTLVTKGKKGWGNQSVNITKGRCLILLLIFFSRSNIFQVKCFNVSYFINVIKFPSRRTREISHVFYWSLALFRLRGNKFNYLQRIRR